MIAIPSHFRVAEISNIALQYGVAFVLGKGISAVGTIGDGLVLSDFLRLREDSHYSVLAKAGGVVAVNDNGTGEDGTDRIRGEGNRVLLPTQEIGRSSMSPVHRSPCRTERIVLVVEMPDAGRLVIEHTIRVVHPVRLGRVMIDRTVRFVGRMRSRFLRTTRQQHRRRQQSKKKVIFHRMYFY